MRLRSNEWLSYAALIQVGLFISCGGGNEGNPLQVVTVTVSASKASVPVGGTAAFSASVTGTSNSAVTWSVDGGALSGSIDAHGQYLAPQTSGIYTITAVLAADSSKTGSAMIKVQPTIVLASSVGATYPGGHCQFFATLIGLEGQTLSWSVKESGGGTVDGQGLYTAPPTGGIYTIHVALQDDSTVCADSSISVGGTPLITVVTTDTILDPSGNPYYVPTGQYFSTYNAKLTFLPGVEFHGVIATHGTGGIQAIGTEAKPVILADGYVNANPISGTQVYADSAFQYCLFRKFGLSNVVGSIVGGGTGKATVDNCQGDLSGVSVGTDGSITNSRLSLGEGYVTGGNVILQGNVFTIQSPQYNFFIRNSMSTYSVIKNNIFEVPASADTGSSLAAIIVTNPGAAPLIKGNSFLFYGVKPQIIVDITSGFDAPTSATTMDWSGNYWGTSDETSIISHILDARTYPYLLTTIGIDPILTAPDPNTPLL